MPLVIRAASAQDARAYLDVHRAAVRGIAAKDYPPAVIEDWARLPLTEETIERFCANPDSELRLVGEIDGRVVGIGALVVKTSELRACYVAPDHSRTGVGSALVRELERTARASGLTRLELESSITAEPFYVQLGYRPVERCEHVLRSGRAMACVKMRKDFALGRAETSRPPQQSGDSA